MSGAAVCNQSCSTPVPDWQQSYHLFCNSSYFPPEFIYIELHLY